MTHANRKKDVPQKKQSNNQNADNKAKKKPIPHLRNTVWPNS